MDDPEIFDLVPFVSNEECPEVGVDEEAVETAVLERTLPDLPLLARVVVLLPPDRRDLFARPVLGLSALVQRLGGDERVHVDSRPERVAVFHATDI